ncbi:hypothetical protein [Candidatus Tremblaya phenacola]|uniref:50S ribosomal protein L23 n=1 Tax=Candidatus Tremblayella phenacoccinincola TaxID=1010676 RepID=A0A2G0V6W8_9PROT|nr:hypothetical protein [Candidatus Tremblaya phenacola]PHN16213.1 hypothetical protein TPPER_00206 [Candidatus Tremblaya phenacola]
MKSPNQYTIIKNRLLTSKLSSNYIVLEVSKGVSNHKLKEALHLILGPIHVSISSLKVPSHKRLLKNKPTQQKLLREKLLKKTYVRLTNILPRAYVC